MAAYRQMLQKIISRKPPILVILFAIYIALTRIMRLEKARFAIFNSTEETWKDVWSTDGMFGDELDLFGTSVPDPDS